MPSSPAHWLACWLTSGFAGALRAGGLPGPPAGLAGWVQTLAGWLTDLLVVSAGLGWAGLGWLDWLAGGLTSLLGWPDLLIGLLAGWLVCRVIY